MSVAAMLAAAQGIYYGNGDGLESGPFVCRIEIMNLPNGGVSIEYEATSREHGVQHLEHSILAAGPDDRDRLYIAHSESPFVTEMVAIEADSTRFVQPEPGGPFVMEVVIEVPEPGRLTYAWWWASGNEAPTEQSKADARLFGPE